jgi:histidinol-phosphate aminotransferase
VPAHIRGIEPYVPGKPIEELERELGLRNSIKLASNENPLGPSPLAVEAVRRAAAGLNRYPDGGGFHLRERLAAEHGVAPGEIILGNGSTEIVELLARTFLGPDGAAVVADQAFIMYRIAVTAVNGRARVVPLRDMRHDLPAMAAAVGPDVRLVYIANPNNPTGTCVLRGELDALFEAIPQDVVVVLDEAYRDYVADPGYPDGLDDLRRGRSIAVLRTFSKIHGLAGLRIGYALTSAAVVDAVERVRSPFNTSALAQSAALAALEDRAHVRASREMNARERDFVQGEMARRGWRFTPTSANFVLLDLGRDAGPVYRALLARGVIVRPMAAYNFPSSLRVTIGTRTENARFLEALDEVLRREAPE